MALDLVTIVLVVLHMVDGRSVTINPLMVTRLSEARDEDDEGRQVAIGIHCVIYLADGRYASVVETCDEVRRLMAGE